MTYQKHGYAPGIPIQKAFAPSFLPICLFDELPNRYSTSGSGPLNAKLFRNRLTGK